MATAQSDVAAARPPAGPPPRLGITGRLSSGHLLVLVVALLAFVVNFAVLRAGDDRVRVAVAATDLRPGERVGTASFAFTELRADEALLAGLLPAAALAEVEGHLVTGPLAAGDLIRRSDLQPPSAPAGQRAMSIPVAPEHAVGGDLAPGDRVDVVEVRGGRARYLVTDAEVLAVASGSGPAGLGGLRAFSVTIAVDEEGALLVAAAIRNGQIELVRATGAAPVEADRSVPDTAGAEEGGG
jgi:Flp pilus assembly protein CpaB